MTVASMCLGMVQTNVYFLENEKTKELIIVDPADSPDEICKEVKRRGAHPVAILLTHGHFDHILATEAVAKEYNIPVIAAKEEAKLLASPRLNMSAAALRTPAAVTPDILLEDNEEPDVSGFKFRLLHTPGHTAGSSCYYFYDDGVLISGDTLFYCSCGRTDLPTASPADMQRSLKRLISELPEDVAVYPGHDRSTTIGFEKRANPFV